MYKQTKTHAGETGQSVIRIADGACIPFDPSSSDYQAYLKWLDEGNEPLPADIPPPPVITEVSMRQARLALLGAGLLGAVGTALGGIKDPMARQAAQIEWEYSTTVHRHGALVGQLAPALGITDSQLDDLFTQAATL